ncbi:MAG: hypothetical protein K5660_00360 [Paludibacteraceae bacterium]|nr:hypothetical protein [Paludibacteraceae bacterium]
MMSRGLSYYISMFLSGLFHPLLIPLYGLFLLVFSVSESGDAYRYLLSNALSVTCLWTLVVPVCALLLMRFSRRIPSLRMTEQSDRSLPYFLCSVCYIVWCVLLWKRMIPIEWLLTAMGGTMALLTVSAVNHMWKISAHATGVGGLTGSVLGYAVSTGVFSWNFFLWVVITAILVMCSRLRLGRHSHWQVTAGWLNGLLWTLLPVYFYTMTVQTDV